MQARMGELREQLDLVQAENRNLHKQIGELMSAKLGLEARVASAEKHFTAQRDNHAAAISDLKGQVLDGVVNVARLEGYMHRVNEDDAVREGPDHEFQELTTIRRPKRDGPRPQVVVRAQNGYRSMSSTNERSLAWYDR